MSWVYLSKGLSYQKAKRAELREYGKIPPFPYMLLNGDSIGAPELKGKLLMVFDAVDGVDASTEVIFKELEKIHRQFDERKDVIFLLQAAQKDSMLLEQLLKRYKLADPGQVYAVAGRPGAGFGRGTKDGGNASLVAIADSSGVIRQYYDFLDGNRVRRSVEHIAMLMPFRDREEAVLKREKEK